MTRAARRREHRERQKAEKKGVAPRDQQIELTNPQRENYGAFVVTNAEHCERVAEMETGHGKTLVICGAGPSLAEHAKDYCHLGDEVWGCNSAATWLYNEGYKVTHALSVDQQPQMIEEWWDAPPLHYLLASTCHPHLVEYLKSKNREITFFHNFVGIHGPAIGICDCGHFHDEHGTKGCNQCDCIDAKLSWMSWEQYLYSTLYEPTVITGSGLNSVTRAIDLAGFRGFDKIYVLGADCALRVKRPMPNVRHGSPAHIKWLKEETVMHADGGHALASDATPVTLGGYIDGRHWETKPDLAISALWLVKMAKAIDQLELIGDTLPNALMDKDDDYLDRMPNLSDPSGRIKNFIVNEQDYHFRACEHNETAI